MNNHHIEGDPHRYPNLFDRWNRAHRGAYKKGVAAYHAGDHLIHGCPYEDKRKESGRLSWSRSFICAWEDGWRDARSQSSAPCSTRGTRWCNMAGKPPDD